MEFLLVAVCFFLWRIASWAKACATSLSLLSDAVAENQRHLLDGLSRIENQVFDANEKLAGIERTTDEYQRVFIQPLKGHY
jgi:hypothetical protein